MPLEPLKDTSGSLKRVARWFRAVPLPAELTANSLP